MDSNVTKNTFLYKFLKLDFHNNILGIKQVLEQYLLQAICLYRQQNKIEDNWDSILVSISDQLVLRNIDKHKIATNQDYNLSSLNYWVYRCAISFPLANYCGVKPLEMAQKLLNFLTQVNLGQVTKTDITVIVKVIAPGWIDFAINHHNLGVWIEQLTLKLKSDSRYRIKILSECKNLYSIKKNSHLFEINYYHARCCSLLKLGERARLIELDNHNFQTLAWQITNPNPIIWFDATNSFLLIHPQEVNLLHYLLLIFDQFGDRKIKVLQENTETTIWINWGLDLGQAFEQFLFACRFCGEVKKQNQPLAVARLGLVALVQWCLFKLLREKLEITSWTEL